MVAIYVLCLVLVAVLAWAEFEVRNRKRLNRSRLLHSIDHLPPDMQREILTAHDLRAGHRKA